MTKLVNLDELSAAKRQIKFKGETHEVQDLSLSDFVEFQKEFQQMIEAQSQGEVDVMLSVSKIIIQRCIPTFTRTDELNMRQLMATVQLVADFYPTSDDAGNVE